MKKCPYCGAQMNDDSLFCTECGKQISQGVVCPHCGASINEGDVFCQSCGKKVDETASTELSKTQHKRCSNCGSLVNDCDAFCQRCGTPLTGMSKQKPIFQSELSYDESVIPTGYKKIIIPIVIVLFVLAIIGGGWWYYNSSKAPLETKKTLTVDSIATIDSVAVTDEEVATIDTVTADTVAADVTPNKEIVEEYDLIKEFYTYIIGEKEMTEDVLDAFLSKDMKQSLWELDEDGHYAYWRFRTAAQEGNEEPVGSDGIKTVSSDGNSWYTVSYVDMGYNGLTKVKVVNGKIVGLKQDKSWDE